MKMIAPRVIHVELFSGPSGVSQLMGREIFRLARYAVDDPDLRAALHHRLRRRRTITAAILTAASA